jgi:hypothetical protein
VSLFLSRRELLAGVSALALVTHLPIAEAFPRGGAASQASNLSNNVVTLNVFATTSSAVAPGTGTSNGVISFRQGFAAADAPIGYKVVPVCLGQALSFTRGRTNRRIEGDNSLRETDFIGVQLPASVPAGPTGAPLPIEFIFVPGSMADYDVLPAGTSQSSIFADYGANHDNISVHLSSLINAQAGVQGSGNWKADLLTALTLGNPNGNLVITAQGATCLEGTASMKIVDESGGAVHPNLWIDFYFRFHLNPTTGAVIFVEHEPWLSQGFQNQTNNLFRCKAQIRLGTTNVRTFGFTTDDPGNRILTFAPSAINTSTNRITIPNHPYQNGDAVVLNCSGTFPTATVNGNPFTLQGANIYVAWIDANTIQLSTNSDPVGLGPNIFLTSQGTGTLGFDYNIEIMYASRLPLCRLDGQMDRWAGKGNTQFAALPAVWLDHDIDYLRKAGLIAPVDTMVNPTTPATQPAPPWQFNGPNGGATQFLIPGSTNYSPGTFGVMTWQWQADGGSPHIGFQTQWIARNIQRRADWNGFVRIARIQAMMQGTAPIHWRYDDGTDPAGGGWRIIACNNGTNNSGIRYPGLNPFGNASLYSPGGAGFNFWVWDQAGSTGVIKSPLGGLKAFAFNQTIPFNPSHYPSTIRGVYAFEGRQSLLDLMVGEATHLVLMVPPGSVTGGGNNRIHVLTTGYNAWCMENNDQARADAWALNVVSDAAISATNDSSLPGNLTSEGLYLRDLVNDYVLLENDMVTRHTTKWPSYNATGAFLNNGNESTANLSECVDFMQWMSSCSFALTAGKWQTAGATTLATFVSKYIINHFVTASITCLYSTSYRVAIKRSPLNNLTDDFLPVNSWGAWEGTSVNIDANGVFTRVGVTKFTLVNGDKIRPTDTDVADEIVGTGPWPTAGLTKYADYTLTNVNNSTHTFQLIDPNTGVAFAPGVIPPTNGVNWFYLAFGSSTTPSQIFGGSDLNWVQGYLVMAICACAIHAYRGIIPSASFLRALACYNLAPPIDSPLVNPGWNMTDNPDMLDKFLQTSAVTSSGGWDSRELVSWANGGAPNGRRASEQIAFQQFGSGPDSDYARYVSKQPSNSAAIPFTAQDLMPFSSGTYIKGLKKYLYYGTGHVDGNIDSLIELRLDRGRWRKSDDGCLWDVTPDPLYPILSSGTTTGTPLTQHRVRPDGTILMSVGVLHTYSQLCDCPEIGAVFATGTGGKAFCQIDRATGRWLGATTGFSNNVTDANHDGSIGDAGNSTDVWMPSIKKVFRLGTNPANFDMYGAQVDPVTGFYKHFTSDAGKSVAGAHGCIVPDPLHPGDFAYICFGYNYGPGASGFPNGAMICWHQINQSPSLNPFPSVVGYGNIASGSGTVSVPAFSGTMTVSGSSGVPLIAGGSAGINGSDVSGSGFDKTIISFGTGTGGDGTYNVNAPANAIGPTLAQWGISPRDPWFYLGDYSPGVQKVLSFSQANGAFILDLTAWISSGGVTAPTWSGPVAAPGFLPIPSGASASLSGSLWSLLFPLWEYASRGKWFGFISSATANGEFFAVRFPDTAW